MELSLNDAIGDWESEGGASAQQCGPPTNAMQSTSHKQVEQHQTDNPSWQERNLGRREPPSEKAGRTGYEPGSWQERNIGSSNVRASANASQQDVAS